MINRLLAVLTVLCLCGTAHAQRTETFVINGKSFEHIPRSDEGARNDCTRLPDRSIDGTCNNVSTDGADTWGAADIELTRWLPAAYGMPDHYNEMAGNCRLSPRAISNLVVAQDGSVPSPRGLSSLVFTWGQFIDHDLTLTPETEDESVPVLLPSDEPLFTTPIPFHRSAIADGSGTNRNREQRNLLTSWLDASMVYGSDEVRADWLRTHTHGKLKSSDGELLPWNTLTGEFGGPLDPDAPSMAGDAGGTQRVFVAGDVRANEQPGLTSLHTLFVREHNRICDRLVERGQTNDDQNYRTARRRVAGLIQAITYYEFLPALGVFMPDYTGYDDSVRPDISNLFATAAYRLGHTMVTDEVPLVGPDCTETTLGLFEAFFDPSLIADNGIEVLLRGLASQTQEAVDAQIVDNLRNFLFPSAGGGPAFGIDLASLNLQRGRDHGLPDYHSIRTHFLGTPAEDFTDVTSDPDLQTALEMAYGNVFDVDAWVGLLAEDPLPGSSVGPTLHALLVKQFHDLRIGDYYFFLNDPAVSPQLRDQLLGTTLAEIIERNTSIEELQDEAFFAASCEEPGGGGGGGGGNGPGGGGGGPGGGGGNGGGPGGGGNGGGGNGPGGGGGNGGGPGGGGNLVAAPNPAGGTVWVDFPEDRSELGGRLTVTNTTGQRTLVRETEAFATGTQLDVSQWTPGVYLLTLERDGVRTTVRLVVE